MKFLTRSNIIPLFKGVVGAIQPYAKSNQVSLIFKPEITELIVEYHPEIVIHDVTQLLCNIIAFTPQTYSVEMNLNEVIKDDETYLEIGIENDGANLARITEITAPLSEICNSVPNIAEFVILPITWYKKTLNLEKDKSVSVGFSFVTPSGREVTMLLPSVVRSLRSVRSVRSVH